MSGGKRRAKTRADKPHANSENLKQILSRPTRDLTKAEAEERTSFYADNPTVQATPVHPGGNYGSARG